MQICPLIDVHRSLIGAYIRDEWGGPLVVSRGKVHNTDSLPGFIAEDEHGTILGAVLYHICDGAFEIVLLYAAVPNQGVGTALLHQSIREAISRGCFRVWLITTNDNTAAIRYYQRYGFSLYAVHINALEEARKLKPEVPLRGIDGIPISHEFEFEIVLEKE